MTRLNIELQQELEPKRLEYAKTVLEDLGVDIHFEDEKSIKFMFKGHEITFFPYSGWHTGKTIKDGRGLKNLIRQLKNH